MCRKKVTLGIESNHNFVPMSEVEKYNTLHVENIKVDSMWHATIFVS
jgi:hypothetical protein